MKTPCVEVEEGAYRQRPPSILWFGGSCSSIYSSFEHFPYKDWLCKKVNASACSLATTLNWSS